MSRANFPTYRIARLAICSLLMFGCGGGEESTLPPPLSSDASLSRLSAGGGTFDPAFSPSVFSYTATVPDFIDRVTVCATTSDRNASVVMIGSNKLINEFLVECDIFLLAVGRNTFSIRVTAEDGGTTRTYTIVVTRLAALPPPPATIGGVWVGTDSRGLEILALFTESGRVHWVEPATGNQGFGTGSVNFTAVTINYTYAGPLGSGSTTARCSATGTIQERQSLDVTAICTNIFGFTFENPVSLTYDPLYDRDSSLSVIAGNYHDFSSVVNIAANGVIFEQDPVSGCVINGQVSIINSQFNVYDVSITYSTCVRDFAVLNGETFTGLAILDNTVTPEQVFVALTGAVTTVVGGTALRPVFGRKNISIVLTLPRI